MVENHPTKSETFIVFELADTTYAIPSQLVQQMEMVEGITPVPNAETDVEGVIFSRGQVIPVLNLRVRLGLEKIPYSLRTRLIVVNVNRRTIGLIVDTAREFLAIPSDTIQPPPEGITGSRGKCLSGIATRESRVILILDVAELLAPTEASNPVKKETGH
ncbi:chemotaxis protein CheW [Phormidium sp. CCY1219]|jgi:chemotaxis signal transduction protein|uniref:chemotaxis protein CheW n=1 Tax=Phormidium sp. CCY1219 TaxID=2886104 RepID=UPI002D1F47C7|nr:chemotaxis protein CheW [Phormidium sp. CCY1219]MEB3829963.1 chemotaxis protein CheW [Phormidium sp. CCY1219]